MQYGRNWDVKGVDIGIVNRSDRDLDGAQFAFVDDHLQGLQYNWLVSSVRGETEGAQFGAVNYARDGALGGVLSRRAGCKSTNYPCLVIKGKRNLTEEMALRFAEACGLRKSEVAYFCDLVQYNHASGGPAKERCYARLLGFAQFRKVHQLSAAQAHYFSEWYIPAVRELAARADFRADAEWIAGQLLPSITLPQAKKALKVLFELGFLIQDEQGAVRRAHELVSSGGPLGHQLIAYHRAMLERASAAIDLVPRDEREISSVTLCVSQTKLLELKQQIRDFRKQLLQTAECDNEFARVIQVSFQLFPLSKGL